MTLLDRILDRSIVASFDRTGFLRHRRHFVDVAMRDLRGVRVLVTGGTAGIGRAAVEALVDDGADVEVWGRSPDRARGLSARFVSVDLGNLHAVAEHAPDDVDTVVLNAGAMPLQRQLTPQGHELIWGSQVLGHLLLLRKTRPKRAIWVSSGGMYAAKLDLGDLRRDRRYQRHSVYANAKRAQVELAAHLAERWPETWQASMHPGWVETDAVRHSMPIFFALTRPTLRTPEQGADTIVWLVRRADPGPSGRFWFDRREAPVHLSKRTLTSPETREQLIREVFAATSV